ncbi:hypothetical protein ACIRU3_12970 [Streptomyces sp. NPDC101151]|uniref:hypothetical protein n=1 Tax=Streptomyces sp. NPDC101151 TaxID=3366115 RepID=UPI0037FBDCC8
MAAVPQDLLDRIRTLERQVRELSGRAQIRPALSTITHGTVTIGEGGQLFVQQPGGGIVFGVGQSPQGDWATAAAREDGTTAFSVGGNRDAQARQMVRIWSRDQPNDVLLMDDGYSPRFLGRPWMPVPLTPTSTQLAQSTSYQFAWVGGAPAHNAVMVLTFSTIAGDGGGQVRVNMLPPSGGSTTVGEFTVTANTWLTKTLTIPLNGVRFLDYVGWNIEHRAKTSGQYVETRVFTSYTRNTFTAAEAPTAPQAAATKTAMAGPRRTAADDAPPWMTRPDPPAPTEEAGARWHLS